MEEKKNNLLNNFIRKNKFFSNINVTKTQINNNMINIEKNEIVINYNLFLLIICNNLISDFIFIGLPKTIIYVDIVLDNMILETSKVLNGIVMFKSFSFEFGEDPLIPFITSFPKFYIRGAIIKHDISKIKFKFNILTLPILIYKKLKNNKYKSLLPIINGTQLVIHYNYKKNYLYNTYKILYNYIKFY